MLALPMLYELQVAARKLQRSLMMFGPLQFGQSCIYWTPTREKNQKVERFLNAVEAVQNTDEFVTAKLPLVHEQEEIGVIVGVSAPDGEDSKQIFELLDQFAASDMVVSHVDELQKSMTPKQRKEVLKFRLRDFYEEHYHEAVDTFYEPRQRRTH
jgi:hypothetical protein